MEGFEFIGAGVAFMIFLVIGIFILMFVELIAITLRIGNTVKELRIIKGILNEIKEK